MITCPGKPGQTRALIFWLSGSQEPQVLKVKSSAADDETQRTCHVLISSWHISVMVD